MSLGMNKLSNPPAPQILLINEYIRQLLIIHVPSLSRCNDEERHTQVSFFFLNIIFKGTYEIFSVIIFKPETPKALCSKWNLVNLLVLWMKEATDTAIKHLPLQCEKATYFESQFKYCIVLQPLLSQLSPSPLCSLYKNFRCRGSFLYGIASVCLLFPCFVFRQSGDCSL